MIRLGLAAVVSGLAAGLLASLALFFAGLLFGAPGGWWAFAMLAHWLPLGLLAGLAVASPPAFFAGASMWALGESFAPASTALAWSAAGAVVGGALWTLICLVLGSVGAGGLHAVEVALLAPALIGGVGGALTFLGAMRLIGDGRGEPRRRPR